MSPGATETVLLSAHGSDCRQFAADALRRSSPDLDEPDPDEADDVESDTYRPWYRDIDYDDDDADRVGSDESR
jgi:hypothetical protein